MFLAITKIFIIALAFSNCTHWRDERHYKLKVRILEGFPYAILRRSMSWDEGDGECARLFGTKLVSLFTKAESDVLANAIKNISITNGTTPDFWTAIEKYEFSLDRRYWIGLTDLPTEDGQWWWRVNSNVSAKLSYDNWAPAPDHSGSEGKREHCAALWNPLFYLNGIHQFNDESCMSMYYPICDYPLKKD